MTDASTSDIAPISAVSSHGTLSIAACVDDEVWRVSSFDLESMRQLLHVVHLVVCRIPLCLKTAGISAALVRLVLAHQAVVVSCASSCNPGAHDSKGLIVGYICTEAPKVGELKVHRSEE